MCTNPKGILATSDLLAQTICARMFLYKWANSKIYWPIILLKFSEY